MTTLRFDEHRAYLTKLAYRMLGSVADAEDVVQETFVRWQTGGEPELVSPRAWLARTCTRLCLDQLKSAHHKRVTYVGEWLPEPLVERTAEKERIDESLSIALLLSIERLRPTERAVFLLHDVFDHPFDEVSAILDIDPVSCRQIASRARRFLEAGRVRARADVDEVTRISNAFFEALDTGNVAALTSVLASDVVMRSDGGGKANAVPHPIVGAGDVSAFLSAIFARGAPVFDREAVWFNGAPGVLLSAGGTPLSAIQFEILDGRIQNIFVQRNPDKLKGFGFATA